MNNQKAIEKLILEIADGNEEAFESLYKQIDKIVYAYALAILKNHEIAQDVMQDTFIKVNEAASKYVSYGKPLAWILRITKNFALMSIRKNKKEQLMDIEENQYLLNQSIEFNEDEKIVLKSALCTLDSEEREIVFLYIISGFKHREISEILSKPLGTVLWRYNNALKKLRKELKEVKSVKDVKK